MKKFVILLIILFIPFTVYAENKEKLVKEYLEITRIKEIFEETWKQSTPLFEEFLESVGEGKSINKEEIETLKHQYQEAFHNAFHWENYKRDYIRIYSDMYDEEELSELINFYNSPLGQKEIERYIAIQKALVSTAIEKREELKIELDNINDNFIDSFAESAITKHAKKSKNYRLSGDFYFSKKEYEKSIQEYKKAIEQNPNDDQSINNLAWLLAACPEEKYRNGNQALILAKKAAKLNPEVHVLDTLAAAYAETGDFIYAIKILEDVVLKVLKTTSDEKRLKYYTEHLEHVRERQKAIRENQ